MAQGVSVSVRFPATPFRHTLAKTRNAPKFALPERRGGYVLRENSNSLAACSGLLAYCRTSPLTRFG